LTAGDFFWRGRARIRCGRGFGRGRGRGCGRGRGRGRGDFSRPLGIGRRFDAVDLLWRRCPQDLRRGGGVLSLARLLALSNARCHVLATEELFRDVAIVSTAEEADVRGVAGAAVSTRVRVVELEALARRATLTVDADEGALLAIPRDDLATGCVRDVA